MQPLTTQERASHIALTRGGNAKQLGDRVFEDEVRRALDYVSRGASVRIIGAAGSGRSTVARTITADLEKTGVEVFSLFGERLLRETPLAGIEALGLDLRARLNGPHGIANVLAERLAREGTKVIVVDDIDLLDNESLAVVDMVQKRTQRPLVMTMGDSSFYSPAPMSTLDRWPEAQIRLGPLRYDQVTKLVVQTLGAPPDVDSTAHILMKSAGNPRLAVRIVQSAVLSKLLILSDGEWRMAGHTLWSEHLHGAVEAHLHGLSADEMTAMHTISVLGTRPMELLQPMLKPDMLDALERRGMVAVMEDVNNNICVAVSPPIVVDYFRHHHVLASRRILADHIAREVDSHLQQKPAKACKSLFSQPLAALISDLRSESEGGAAAARHFQEQLRVLEEHHYGLWESERTMSTAAAFLKFYWGRPIDPTRVEEVFTKTETAGADPAHHFFFTMTRALWAISHDDLLLASGILKEIGEIHPDWKAEAEAFGVFLNASFDRMPGNWDALMDGLTSHHPESGVLPVIRGILEVYRYDAQAALLALDSAEGFDLAGGMEPFVRGLALHVAGRADEALIFALNQRAAARRSLDQFGFVANSYVAGLVLTQRGLSMEAEHMMSSVFALGRPGFLVSFLHNAMLRIAGLRVLAGSGRDVPSLGAQARKGIADIGPLPGIGKAVYELVSQQYNDPDVFDEKAVTILDRQIDRGYIAEAVYASLFMLSLLPGHRILERIQWLFRENGVTSHEQFLAIAMAVADRDHQLLRMLLDQYEPDADLNLIGMLLKGASKRHMLRRDVDSAATLQRISQTFNARFPTPGEHLSLHTSADEPQPLSARETEIAVLAGSQTNTEIATRLGISTRTVENHISRALRKTGTVSRKTLYEFVRSLRS